MIITMSFNILSFWNISLVLGILIVSECFHATNLSSILAGILLVYIPQYVNNLLLRSSVNKSPKDVLATVYMGSATKYTLTIVLFIGTFSLLSVNGAVFCLTYVLVQLSGIMSTIYLNKAI